MNIYDKVKVIKDRDEYKNCGVHKGMIGSIICGEIRDSSFHVCFIDPKFSDKNTVYALEAGWTASAWNYTYNYIFPVAHKSTLITQDEAKYRRCNICDIWLS